MHECMSSCAWASVGDYAEREREESKKEQAAEGRKVYACDKVRVKLSTTRGERQYEKRERENDNDVSLAVRDNYS